MGFLFLNDITEMDWIMNRMVVESLRFLMEYAPTLQKYSTDILSDWVFVPRIVAKQMLLALVLEFGQFVLSQTYQTLVQGFLVQFISSRARMLQQLTKDQQQAKTQDEYMMIAEEIDAIAGNQEWRMDPNCPLYEMERITTTMNHYLHLMRRHQVFDLLFVLRGSLGRNRFGLQHKGLFNKAQAGTKVLVETYHNVVCAALDFVCDAPASSWNNEKKYRVSSHYSADDDDDGNDDDDDDDIPTAARLAFFNEVRHAYGRSSLLLSGGAALGYYHVGVVKALMENNLMPRVIGGSSAGSIVCAMIGTRTDEECMHDFFQMRGTRAPGHSGSLQLEFFRPILYDCSGNKVHHSVLNKSQQPQQQQSRQSAIVTAKNPIGLQSVYKNSAGAFHSSKRAWQFLLIPVVFRDLSSYVYDLFIGNRRAGDLLKSDTEHLKNVVKNNCGDFTFQEAFDRTGRICNIIVSPKNQSDPPRLLNYLTAPHVLVWSAAVASASVPGIFEADCLMVKDPDGTERYESSRMATDGVKHRREGVQFSDGSFEQDLPMEQLSEMFNVNHFIISQTNPQAVLFGSYNHRSNVWSNPVKGFVDSLLKFLKHQCRTWIVSVTKFLGSGRFRPLYAQRRANIGTQLLTQEYEGRDCDISLIPWLNHRSLQSAFLHMLYNPTPRDFFEWTAAAERETWKYIPRIKCHIAEEIALDQCVQRLRNRLVMEARTACRGTTQTSKMISNGLPSFFASPSLAKLSTPNDEGEGVDASQFPVLKQQNRSDIKPSAQGSYIVPSNKDARPEKAGSDNNNLAEPFDINSGWAGLGLRGNRSSGSLERQFSHPSKLFISMLCIMCLLPTSLAVNSPHKAPLPMLDLSHRHDLGLPVLEEVIRRSLWDDDALSLLPGDDGINIQVDLSNSLFGRDMARIWQALLPLNNGDYNHQHPSNIQQPTTIHLFSQKNRITPHRMDELIQKLLSSSSFNETIDMKTTLPVDHETCNDATATDTLVSTTTTLPPQKHRRAWKVETLDMSWNPLQPHGAGWKPFLNSLQKLLQSSDVCPTVLRLNRCGLGPGVCRAIGKGIIQKESLFSLDERLKSANEPLSLHLSGNPDLGNSGTAALAAAIRTVNTKDAGGVDTKNDIDDESGIIFDSLDLSACNVGDVGAEALALALESRRGMCIRHLDLSHNQISDVGAAAIGRALESSGAVLESLDLSGNKGISDQSAMVVASAFKKGMVTSIRMRSCHICADGAEAFGKAIRILAMKSDPSSSLLIDLSGNPLGVLRGKTSKDSKYSASAIKSKATATTSAYVNIIRKGIKSGLKEYGVDAFGSTAESDDDEEARNGIGSDLMGDGNSDPSKARCGIKAFANAFLDSENKGDEEITNPVRSDTFKCQLCLRHCFLDHSAADALAAVLVYARDDMGIDLAIDIGLNPVLEDDMRDALQGDDSREMVLRDMSDRYHDALETLRESRERAADAALAAARRIEKEAELEAQWDAPEGFGDDTWNQDDDDWDSDDDYELENAEYDY